MIPCPQEDSVMSLDPVTDLTTNKIERIGGIGIQEM